MFLLWWLALAVGVAGIAGAAFHVFDGPAIAEMIGYTRGDGGFQFENAMGDLAIGVAGVLCIWIRGNFWLATIVVTSIQYYGDALVGHVHQWLANGNTEPGNIGIPLYLDVIVPVVATVLYVLMRRASRKEESRSPGPRRRPPSSPPPSSSATDERRSKEGCTRGPASSSAARAAAAGGPAAGVRAHRAPPGRRATT